MITKKDAWILYQMLIAAEHRLATRKDAGVRERTTETVSLCKERMVMEGLTREALLALAMDEKETS